MALALCALTCHENTNFHLLETGGLTLDTVGPPTQSGADPLTGFDLAAHTTMKRQGLHPSDLRTVRPYSVLLSAVDPASGQDLRFLRRVHVTLSVPGGESVVLATGEDFAPGTNSVGLEVVDAELLHLVKTRQMTAQVVFDDADAPPVPVRLNLAITFAVDVAQPKGACG